MKKHLIALAERVSSTFLYSFIGVVVATSGNDGWALRAGAIAGGLSVAKYLYTLAGAYLAKPDPLLAFLAVKPDAEKPT